MFDFSEEEIARYSRHILLKDLGVEGQEKIRNAKVLVVGVGGLGAPVLFYLAAAGIGTIGLIDDDTVDLSNLQRQIIHFTKDVGQKKVSSAHEKIREINPNVEILVYEETFNAGNAERIIENFDFVVDGTDNFRAKYLINDVCVMKGKSFCQAGIFQFEGQVFTHVSGSSCYRCIFPTPPESAPSCAQAGVMGSVAGMLGTIQATETLKYFTGIGNLLTNSLLTIDAKTMEFSKLSVNKKKNCPICGENPSITTLIEYERKVCELKKN